MSDAQRRFRNTILLPISLIVGGLIIAVLVLAFTLAQRQTSDAIAVQRNLAKGMLGVRLDEMEKVGNDYANWDEAFQNLVVHPDGDWADANIGSSLVDRYGFEMAFVVDDAGITTYGMIDRERSPIPVEQALSGGFDRLLLARKLAGSSETRSGLLMAEGRPALVTVSPLRPFSGPDVGTVGSRHILVFVDRLDDTQLKRLSETYQLPNLHLMPPSEANAASNAFTTLDGGTPVRLAWDGANPGGDMLRDLLPIIGSLLASLAILAIIVLRHAAASTSKLDASERRATRDALTDLLNRSALLEDLELVRSPSPFALLYLDLDGFKAINDTYGHDVGDEVLIEVAARLTTWAPARAKIYRLGGDEFALVMWGYTKIPAIRLIAERIIQRLAEPIMLDAGVAEIGATIGVAIATARIDDTLEVLKKADQALYVGKRGPKGTVRFHVDLCAGPSPIAL